MKKDLQAQSKEWFDLKKLTPDKMALAKLALADIREGVEVFDAIKRYPLQTKGGGYIGKQMLVAAYRKMVGGSQTGALWL